MQPADTPYERGPDYPEHYRDRRFSVGTGARTQRRELRALSRLLSLVPDAGGPWLDIPSGAGRLSALLPGPVVQVDRNRAILAASPGSRPRVCASGSRLPFPAESFGGVLCFRLMHHLQSRDERVRILSELARVSRGPVLVSYFDAVSLQHVRRILRRKFGLRRSGREAIPWREFRDNLHRAGLSPLARIPIGRWISEQCVVLARHR